MARPPLLAQVVLDTAYLLAILAGAGGVIAFLFRALISSKDRELASIIAEKDKEAAELTSMKKSYQEIAQEAVKSALGTTNYYREKDGKPPILPVAPVISESHSASTSLQREVAVIQTLRATITQIMLEAGQEPRKEPEHGA